MVFEYKEKGIKIICLLFYFLLLSNTITNRKQSQSRRRLSLVQQQQIKPVTILVVDHFISAICRWNRVGQSGQTRTTVAT